MLALTLSVGLFALFVVVGTVVIAVLRYDGYALQNILLAPAAGLAVVLLIVFFVSRAGLPLGLAGRPILVVSVGGSAFAWWRMRPAVPIRAYLPFLAILIAAILATGRPMLEFGFDWVSYSNDDMANYTLAAQRLVNHGFFDIPSADELVTGRDYSLSYWFFDLGLRPGAEMLTGWVSGATGLSPHQVFMPLIVALHVVMVSAACALACQTPQLARAALVACGLLAVSAMASLGALYQLIGQVGGLALLAGTATTLMRPFGGLDRRTAIRQGVMLGLLGAALLVMYPEVAPFLGLSWLLYLGVALIRRRERAQALIPVLLPSVVSGLLLLNTYSLISIAFLGNQASAGLAHTDPRTSLFPYFLVPSGLAILWGFQALVELTTDPLLSGTIGLGAILLAGSIYTAARGTWRLHPSAVITLVMLGLAAELFIQRGDFGLFKLAMYVQPFLLPTLVIAWMGVARQRLFQIVPLVAIGVLGLHAQTEYVDRSRGYLGGTGGGLTEIPNASGSRINSEFEDLLSNIKPDAVTLDTSNIVLAKFEAVYLRGIASTFPTQDFFSNIAGADPGMQVFNPRIAVAARELHAARNEQFKVLQFNLLDPQDPELRNGFVADVNGQPPQFDQGHNVLVQSTARQSLLNRWRNPPEPKVDFLATNWQEVSNQLIFITSQLGQAYYTADRAHVALYQLEPDLYYTGASMGGLGRHFLFQVVNPSDTVRLELDMTATLKGDGENRLPPASAVGATREFFPLVGRGSARVFSPPIRPQLIDGRAYVAIDMGTDGQRFRSDRTGLMGLYGLDVPLDRRSLVGFGRDLSVISNSEYEHLVPPESLDSFPESLANPQLQYSGVYEDGWISDEANLQLHQPSSSMLLHLRGSVPDFDRTGAFSSDMRIVVDGREIGRSVLSAGDFDLRFPISDDAGNRNIRLAFSNPLRLPGLDQRLVGAQLYTIGFEPGSPINPTDGVGDIAADWVSLSLGSGWFPLEHYAGETFRWVQNDAQIRFSNMRPGIPLRLDMEAGPGAGARALPIEVFDDAGNSLVSFELAGRQSILVPLERSHAGSLVVRIHAGAGGLTTPNDPRILNFRVFSIGWDRQADQTTAQY